VALAATVAQDTLSQLESLLSAEHDPIANAANMSALLFEALDDVNWVGFYFLKGEELVVGPFQGKPACVRIPMGRGVCGKAAQERKIIRVDDVHDFADHIVCDVASRSEIVVPLIKGEKLIGVLDIDSPIPARFTEGDETLLSEAARIYVDSVRH
jgi:L-methionine (R)-S-oxide reductase